MTVLHGRSMPWPVDGKNRLTAAFCMALVWLALPTFASAQGQAIPGQPFGVASISVPVGSMGPLSWKAITVAERDGRLFYPAIRSGLLPGAAEADGVLPGTARVSFLFVGDEPLELTVNSPESMQLTLLPTPRQPRVFRRQLMRWWRDFNASIRQDDKQDDYPQIVNVYLTSMLGNRLGLEPPLLSRRSPDAGSELQQTLELLSGAEGLREHLVREMMDEDRAPTGGDDPPTEVNWLPMQPPDSQGGAIAAFEPMASRVPVECFYVRFGQFDNYLWLSGLLKEYGGDIGRMVSLRSQDPGLNQRIQGQLALRQGKLAEILGGQVVADVAIIGRDLYMTEGPAIGVLFQARNNIALTTDLTQQRQAALSRAQDDGATLEVVEIGGREVSFLSTPSNRLRSFYAVDGDFHLVTTSREIVRRFFETGLGRGVLGESFAFQRARQEMPVDDEHSIFAFFSPEFFQALISPQYQIGLRRRLQADAAIVLVQLARLAAQSEGMTDITIEHLVAAGLLPAGFGRLADRSGPILATHEVVDSLRGKRGSFTPLPDLPLHEVSRQETQWYARVADYFQQNWQQMDPLLVGIHRRAGEQPGSERIVVDANISPLAEEKYGWILSVLGPPSTHELRPSADDIISMQAMVNGGRFSADIPPHHLFLGIKDSDLPPDPWPTGFLQTIKMLTTTPGYLGAWPKLGFLDFLPFGLGGQRDVAGFSQLPLGAWRWQGGGFSVVSFQYDVLANTVPQLEIVPTDNPAQIRIHVGDLSQSHLSNWINAQNYGRAFRASVGNARLIRTLSAQFGVPHSDAKDVAESLLNSQLVCALGGDYEYDSDRDSWYSTNWPVGLPSHPEDYRAPLMNWFRGAKLDLIKDGDRLVMHAYLDMQRDVPKRNSALPFLDLFGGSKQE